MAGAYNHNIQKMTEQFMAEHEHCKLYVLGMVAVSYTHLDVYKRQPLGCASCPCKTIICKQKENRKDSWYPVSYTHLVTSISVQQSGFTVSVVFLTASVSIFGTFC